MEELREKANNYAEENVINVLKEVFAKVYADGYKEGYRDCEADIPVDLHRDMPDFVDLGLPSGTLWSKDYLESDEDTLFYPFCDAKEKNIPNEGQWNELLEICHWQGNYSSTGVTFYGITCIGPNGNSIKFRCRGYMKGEKNVDNISFSGGDAYFWIADETEGNNKKCVHVGRGVKKIPEKEILQIFSGYKLPVRLVKTKE